MAKYYKITLLLVYSFLIKIKRNFYCIFLVEVEWDRELCPSTDQLIKAITRHFASMNRTKRSGTAWCISLCFCLFIFLSSSLSLAHSFPILQVFFVFLFLFACLSLLLWRRTCACLSASHYFFDVQCQRMVPYTGEVSKISK